MGALIVPIGIETKLADRGFDRVRQALIVPIGIETDKSPGEWRDSAAALIVPIGIETEKRFIDYILKNAL